MAQRVLIAGAVSCNPDLLIADEPTTALDVTVQAEVLDLMRTCRPSAGWPWSWSPTTSASSPTCVTRSPSCRPGRIVEAASAEELFGQPEARIHPDVARRDAGERPAAAVRRRQLGFIRATETDRRPRHDHAHQFAGAPNLWKSRTLWSSTPAARVEPQTFRALHGIDLTIAQGETLGSWANPVRARAHWAGLSSGWPRSAGHIRFDGKSISHAKESRNAAGLSRDIQVVFQDPYTSLNPAMTVNDILTEPLLVTGVHRQRRRNAGPGAPRLRASAGRRRPALPREFSGGQRQRVAIARALCRDPKLIVCDEPVSALDLSTQARVLDLFIEIQERTGVAYLFVTHDLGVVRHIGHRVAVMKNGEIVETGDAETITSSPGHPYTQRLLLAAPVPDPKRQAQRRGERQQLLLAQADAASRA